MCECLIGKQKKPTLFKVSRLSLYFTTVFTTFLVLCSVYYQPNSSRRGGPLSDCALGSVGNPFDQVCVCFFVLCNRHWFNRAPGPDPRGTEMGVTYLPSTISSCVSLFYVIDTGSIRPRARVCFFVLCNRHWFNRVPGPIRDGGYLSTLHR